MSPRKIVQSTKWHHLPDGVTIETEKGTPRPWKPEESVYEVFVDGTHIGSVESTRTESWRTNGRIRTSCRGIPRHWTADTNRKWTRHDAAAWRNPERIGYQFDTRVAAIERLMRAWQERGS